MQSMTNYVKFYTASVVYVVRNRKITLPCQSYLSEMKTIIWKRYYKEKFQGTVAVVTKVTSTVFSGYTIDTQTGNLTILSVSDEEKFEGRYICKVINKRNHTEEERNFTVDILGE